MNEINWNGVVTLKPNSIGWEIWETFYSHLGMAPPEHGDTIEIPLWEAANIFGSNLYNGSRMIFENTSMKYRIP